MASEPRLLCHMNCFYWGWVLVFNILSIGSDVGGRSKFLAPGENSVPILDGPAIRNANWGDSRESIRANRFAEKKKKLFHNVQMIRANCLKPAIRNF